MPVDSWELGLGTPSQVSGRQALCQGDVPRGPYLWPFPSHHESRGVHESLIMAPKAIQGAGQVTEHSSGMEGGPHLL